jgi:hypothetical protein
MEIQRLSAESRYGAQVWRRIAIRRRIFMSPLCDGGGTAFQTLERP